MQIDVQAQAFVLAALVVANGDANRAIGIIEAEANYQVDRPGLSATLRAVARLARRYVERERNGAASA
jgi:hypothetical protein